jgi:hypothetical protein
VPKLSEAQKKVLAKEVDKFIEDLNEAAGEALCFPFCVFSVSLPEVDWIQPRNSWNCWGRRRVGRC